MTIKTLDVLDGSEYKRSPYGSGFASHHEVVIAARQDMYPVGKIAVEIATRLAIVSAEESGEDSAGRAKLRRSSAAEIAQFACDTAQELWTQIEQRGWMFELPLPSPKAVKEKEDA